MKGWEMTEAETLGMHRILDEQSSLYGTYPAPRVVQNRGDQKLEQYIAEFEPLCLKELQKSMLHKNKEQRKWIVVFLVTLLILNIRERDIWRLKYWIGNPHEVSFQPCSTRCSHSL
jgi:hypothetical protein